MLKIILPIVALTTALTLYQVTNELESSKKIPKEVVTAFIKWQSHKKRLYSTPEEQTHRLRTFHQNYLKVQKVNSQNLSYTFGLNKFADLTPKEFKAKYLSASIKTAPNPKKIHKIEKKNLKGYDEYDWSKLGCNTKIFNQGQCNSAYAISAAKAATYGWYAQKMGGVHQASVQEIIDCSQKFGNYGCGAGDPTNAYSYMMNYGLVLDEMYPYTGRQGTCMAMRLGNEGQKPQKEYKAVSFNQVSSGYNEDLKDAVARQPVTASVDSSTWYLYKGGVFDGRGCSVWEPNHYVTIVGYGVDKGQFWKLENSWGSDWGEGGYMRIKRTWGYNREPCGLTINAWYPDFKQW